MASQAPKERTKNVGREDEFAKSCADTGRVAIHLAPVPNFDPDCVAQAA